MYFDWLQVLKKILEEYIYVAEKKENVVLQDEVITSKIFFVRGEKVMLDRDLAVLFDVCLYRTWSAAIGKRLKKRQGGTGKH